MSLNPLSPVTDYQSLLNRIFWFTSAAALGAVALLRDNVAGIDSALRHIDLYLDTGSGEILPIPAGYLLPALAIGLFARVFRLHGQLSHWLGISERFDIGVILPEFAKQLGIEPAEVSETQWLEHRHHTMRSAFYRFASSNSPQIDPHLVHQALDLWSWFWIGLQSVFVFAMASLVLIAMGDYRLGAATLGATLSFASVGLPGIRTHCRRYAIAQVKAIMADPARVAEVRQVFSWHPAISMQSRLAA